MLLIFARHMFMHTFLFFPILCCALLCSLSLSLSRINCAMAPKAHKSTTTQNPLQGSKSSSSDPFVPLHIQFCDEKARKDFSENFQKRGVHPERQVILSDFADTPLSAVIWTRVGNLFLRDPWGVPLCLYRSFTPIYTTSIPLYLNSLLHSEVHVS